MSATSPPFVDVHTHSRGAAAGVRVLNSGPDDFQRDAAAENYLSLGLHPWQVRDGKWEAQLVRLQQLLPHARVAAVGECGLDRLRGGAPAEQHQVLVRQMECAQALGKPLIIHCVRAFDELIGLKRRHRISVPLLVHGFNVRPGIGERLVEAGFALSFGAALLNAGSAAAGMLGRTPAERLFLETDDADVDIERVYEAAATLLRVPLADLRAQLWNNFRRIFLHE